jgi:hypothetical protein
MKKLFLLIAATFVFTQLSAQTSLFNDLLQAHVTRDGIVDYASFNNEKLDAYLSYLDKTAPETSWSDNKQKAFWINAYNAYTIKKILENYPLKSITDIKENGKTVWKIPFANVGGETYTLDYIEHEILRKKLFDPRIHVAVNCAANSCPKLQNVAFTERNIEATLENLMKTFINDTTCNKIAKHNIQISDSKISYLKYDWSLNGK